MPVKFVIIRFQNPCYLLFNENNRNKENTAKRTMQYLLYDDLYRVFTSKRVGLQESQFAKESVHKRVRL